MLNMALFPQRPTTHTTPTTETPPRPISGYHDSYDSGLRFPTMPQKMVNLPILSIYHYVIHQNIVVFPTNPLTVPIV